MLIGLSLKCQSNKCKLYKLGLISILIIFMILFSSSISYVMAYDDESIKAYLEGTSKFDSNGQLVYNNQVKKIINSNPYDSLNSNSKALEVNIGGSLQMVYLSLESYNQIGLLADRVNEKQRVRGKVDEMSEGFNVEADITGASVLLSGFQPLISTVTGVVLYVVVIGMGLFTVLDIAYITIPLFRGKADNQAQSGTGIMGKVDNRTGEGKLRWITDEAVYAVRVTNTMESGQNPVVIYLGKRIWAYVILGIAIYILATGNIGLIVGIALNAIGGIVDALRGLGGA